MHYSPILYSQKDTINNTKPVVHTLCTFFSAFRLHINSIFHFTAPQSLGSTSLLAPPVSSFSSLSAFKMEARSNERKRTLIEKVRKDSTVEEVRNGAEEKDESVGLTEEEKMKGVGGRKGSSSGGGGVSPPSCQAEKCGADLTDAKKYHRRHKVCEFHSKAAVVVVAGLRQRFCQQCSRFHDLAEFDEAKRSCRRRLAGHNERRRKINAVACNESCSHSQGHDPKESQCRLADERGRIQMSMPGSSGYRSFHIR